MGLQDRKDGQGLPDPQELAGLKVKGANEVHLEQ